MVRITRVTMQTTRSITTWTMAKAGILMATVRKATVKELPSRKITTSNRHHTPIHLLPKDFYQWQIFHAISEIQSPTYKRIFSPLRKNKEDAIASAFHVSGLDLDKEPVEETYIETVEKTSWSQNKEKPWKRKHIWMWTNVLTSLRRTRML